MVYRVYPAAAADIFLYKYNMYRYIFPRFSKVSRASFMGGFPEMTRVFEPPLGWAARK
jgi:hypothetical protein